MTNLPANRHFPLVQKVYIDKKSLDSALTERILANLRGIPREVVRGPRDKQAILEVIRRSDDPVREGKRTLYLTTQKGRFVKPCPCTPRAIGCGYFIINLNLQCPLDCKYCILQHYLADPWLVVFTNLEDLWRELDGFLEKQGRRFVRIGTGELGDSLALDPITHLSTDLISYFQGKGSVSLELKTKTADTRNLPAAGASGNIVISWSLNTERIAVEEEIGAPPVAERIRAARDAANKGYRVGFHFDPLVRYPGWERDYEAVIRSLFQTVPRSSLAWISLGALRFPPALKKVIQTRFPATTIIYDEFILGQDGKLRYFRPLRLELFRKIAGMIKKWGGENIPLYLCMEGANIWREVLKWKPRGKRDVESALTPRSCRRNNN